MATTKKNAAKKTQTPKSSGSSSVSKSETSTGKQQRTLVNLLEDGLKDMYSAESQLMEALPKMAKACYHEELQDAFENHAQETKRHLERLDKVFVRLSIDKSDIETCAAMEGLIEEGNKIMEEYEESPVRDSALIIAAQKVEHYEIASYGSLCELCDVLGYHSIGELLGRTLDDEERTDMLLTEIAMDVNDEAYEASEQEGEDEGITI